MSSTTNSVSINHGASSSAGDFQDKSHWENKVKFMEHSKIFLDYFASDLIQRSMELYFSKINSSQQLPNIKILDVATGTGLVPFKFVDEKLLSSNTSIKCISLDGIDFASGMIEGAQFKKQSRMQDSQFSFDWEQLNFQVMDGQDLRFPNESFDVVYSNMGVLFYPDIVKGLSEIRRVLKQGGMAFLNSWTRDFPTRVHFHATFDVLKSDNRYSLPVFSLEDPQVFENKCKEAGFDNVQIKQVTQVLRMKYSELKSIIRMGSQLEQVIKKHLLENPQCTATVDELLDQIDELSKRELGITGSEEDECEIISAANVAILTK